MRTALRKVLNKLPVGRRGWDLMIVILLAIFMDVIVVLT